MCDCPGYEITLDPWRGGELVIQLRCFEQLKELADQSGCNLDIGKHPPDECLCRLPEELVQRVIGAFILREATEGFTVTMNCP